jgi:hypothetical protein
LLGAEDDGLEEAVNSEEEIVDIKDFCCNEGVFVLEVFLAGEVVFLGAVGLEEGFVDREEAGEFEELGVYKLKEGEAAEEDIINLDLV